MSLQLSDHLKSYPPKEVEYATRKLCCNKPDCVQSYLDCARLQKRSIHLQKEVDTLEMAKNQDRAEMEQLRSANKKLSNDNKILRTQNDSLTRVNSLQKDELIRRKNRPVVQEQREYDSSTTAGINTSSPSITRKSWTPTPKRKRVHEESHQENVNTSTVSCTSNETSSSVTADKGDEGNAQKEKQFITLEKTEYMENMLGAFQNIAALVDSRMEIDTKKSEQNEKADLGVSNSNIADPTDENPSVKIDPRVEDRPIKANGVPSPSCSPIGTSSTEVDSGFVENDNNMDIDVNDADADRNYPTPPLAVQIVEGFNQYFMDCIEPIKQNYYGVDEAIESFFLYTPISPAELAQVEDRMMEAIKQTLRKSAEAILKVGAKKNDK